MCILKGMLLKFGKAEQGNQRTHVKCLVAHQNQIEVFIEIGLCNHMHFLVLHRVSGRDSALRIPKQSIAN